VLERFKQDWRDLRESPPGQRFQQRYKRRQQSTQRLRNKVLSIGGGILIIAAGILLVPVPGPPEIISIIGAGLIAQEFLVVARALDWTELRLRRLATWSLGVWLRASLAVKILLLLFVMALVAAGGAGAYMLLYKK
jgi:hypothetical protein